MTRTEFMAPVKSTVVNRCFNRGKYGYSPSWDDAYYAMLSLAIRRWIKANPA